LRSHYSPSAPTGGVLPLFVILPDYSLLKNNSHSLDVTRMEDSSCCIEIFDIHTHILCTHQAPTLDGSDQRRWSSSRMFRAIERVFPLQVPAGTKQSLLCQLPRTARRTCVANEDCPIAYIFCYRLSAGNFLGIDPVILTEFSHDIRGLLPEHISRSSTTTVTWSVSDYLKVYTRIVSNLSPKHMQLHFHFSKCVWWILNSLNQIETDRSA
jgi:hypothetical protein